MNHRNTAGNDGFINVIDAVGGQEQQTSSAKLRITLLTDADNLAAQRFYRRQGFELSRMLPMWLLLS